MPQDRGHVDNWWWLDAITRRSRLTFRWQFLWHLHRGRGELPGVSGVARTPRSSQESFEAPALCRHMAPDHLCAPGEVTFVNPRFAHRTVRDPGEWRKPASPSLSLLSFLFGVEGEKHNRNVGKCQDGGVGQRRHQR